MEFKCIGSWCSREKPTGAICDTTTHDWRRISWHLYYIYIFPRWSKWNTATYSKVWKENITYQRERLLRDNELMWNKAANMVIALKMSRI